MLWICNALHTTVRFSVCQPLMLLLLFRLCFYPYRKTKNHTSTLTESFRALAIKLWKQIKTICYCPSSKYDFIFPKGAGIITCPNVTISNTFVLFEPFLTKKAALAKINWAEVCVWNMSIWSFLVLEWSSFPFFNVVIWRIYV